MIYATGLKQFFALSSDVKTRQCGRMEANVYPKKSKLVRNREAYPACGAVCGEQHLF
jgi:hypothetical protein